MSHKPLSPPLACRPVVIIGAPRSGTNMLRDILTTLPGIATWPCDEINYIWRHGNARAATDELAPADASPAVVRYVRSHFNRLAQRSGVATVVEKTCANSLRVPFVDAVLPEAKYVFLRRDGRDAVASALLRWRAPLEPRYLWQKAKYVPVGDLPYYAVKYALNRLHRVASREQRLAAWGPRFTGIDNVLRSRSLAEACAVQWRRCDRAAANALGSLSQDRVMTVHYEEFVQSPTRELTRLLEFLELQVDSARVVAATTGVTSASIGKWQFANLPSEALSLLSPDARAA